MKGKQVIVRVKAIKQSQNITATERTKYNDFFQGVALA